MSEETLNAILKEGMKEFLSHGFPGASLRNIARNAGVTTGAVYGYYGSKHELFDALVKEHYDALMKMYNSSHEAFRNLQPNEQSANVGKISGECLFSMADYIYDNYDSFRLILCCSEGTRYVNMIHEMSELEIKTTEDFLRVLKESGHEIPEMDPMLEHMLTSGMLTAFFEIFIHNMPRDKAHDYIESLQTFYFAGWKTLMKI